MKPMKLILIFVVVLTCDSCRTTEWLYDMKWEKILNREIDAELSAYSDVLDISRSQIKYPKRSYLIFHSSVPPYSLKMLLYLKPGSDNRQAVITVRDGLVNLFSDSEGKPNQRYNDRFHFRGKRRD